MDEVLENRFRHVLETENWLQAHVPEVKQRSTPQANSPQIKIPQAPLSGGDDQGKKWIKYVLIGVAFCVGIGSIGYGIYSSSNSKSSDDE